MGLSQDDVMENQAIQKISTNDFTHTVLCEFGSYSTCAPCTNSAQYLHDIFKSNTLDFYYVSLVEDKSTIAHNRLYDDYNIYGFPMCYFDGGYEIKAGGLGNESVYRELIESCGKRVVPNLSMNVRLKWLGDAVFDVNVTIENYENETYNGRVRAYIVEIISRWNQANTEPYHYAFIGWAFNKNISIDAGDTYCDNSTWDGKEHGFSDIDWEEIMVIAAVFNDERHQGYSWFPPDPHPFDAYYVDETVATYFNTTPPNMPTIDGPTCGIVGKSYDYTFNATDPDGDDIWYHIWWGDKEIIYIYGPYHSGESITLSYNWTEKGTYNISCKAVDIYDEESDWAYLEVTMPKSKQSVTFPWIHWFLENHPRVFPILRHLLII